MSSARSYLNVYTPEAMAKTLALRDEQIERLEAENAKLRELCLDAHVWMGRALYDGSARRYEYESITERMRELGIEVEDE